MKELPIITKTLNLIKWYVPLLNGLPRNHHFILGDRIIKGLYDLMEGLIKAKYSPQKLDLLESSNIQLELMRYQRQLLIDFGLISQGQFAEIGQSLQSIGLDLGNWIKYQQKHEKRPQNIELN